MLCVMDLHKRYKTRNRNGEKTIVTAVDGVSFTLEPNTSYSLVGESGSGKSTLARLIACIESATSGTILFDNQNLAQLSKQALRQKRADFQMIMQDGQSALDPRRTVLDSIAEPLRSFERVGKKQGKDRAAQLMRMVELPEALLYRLPHQLSGGQQKRVCIARAISIRPKLIVFDEAVSGLDVTVRKKILNLLIRLRDELKSTYLFITHDIDVAMYMSKDIFVMKEGKIVEHVRNVRCLGDFRHDYSKLLIRSLPPAVPQGHGPNKR